MRLVIDMNLSPRWIVSLRQQGIEAVHWSSIGAADASDREIMATARAEGAIVLTHDLDFGAILAASGAATPSVIQIRAGDVRPEAAATAVAQAVRQCAEELAAGALLTVDPARFRVTMLPFAARAGG